MYHSSIWMRLTFSLQGSNLTPDGLFEKIEREPEGSCLYKRLCLNYTYGLGRIYTEVEIEKAKASPSFEREYNLKYLGKVGNVFHILDIEAAICTQKEGQEMMDWSTSTMIGRSMGIDVAWGDTSKFGIVITQYRNNKVEVFYAVSFEKPLMNEIINHIMRLKQRHHITKLYVDGANPEVIRELKNRIGVYLAVKKAHQDTSITTETDSVTENCNSDR